MKYQGGFSYLLVIFLIIIGIGIIGGGYVLYQDKQQQEKFEAKIKDLNNPTTTTSPSTTSTSTLNEVTKNGFVLTGILCTIDYTLVPKSEANVRRLLDLCEVDVPKLEAKFSRGPSAPPYKILFYTPRPEDHGTGGDPMAKRDYTGVVLSTDYWYQEFPYDAKILAHELTHTVQSYDGYLTPEYPGWLVESLADYGAYIAGYSKDLEKDCYHFLDSSKTNVWNCTYKFLTFVGNKYDPEIPLKLHKALQAGVYSDKLFVQYTGKTFDQLIHECSLDLDCAGVDPRG